MSRSAHPLFRHFLLPFCAILALFALTPAAQAAENKPEGGTETQADTPDAGGFKPITTHIEADVWGFLKIDRPEPDAPRQPKRSARSAGPNNPVTKRETNILGLYLSIRYLDAQQRPRVQHTGVLLFPSVSLHFARENKVDWDNAYHWPSRLFVLSQSVMMKRYADEKDRIGVVDFSKDEFLAVPFFSAFTRESDGPGNVHWEALDLPLSTTISHKVDKDEERWTALNVPLVRTFRYERHGKSSDTKILDVPLAELYSDHQSADGGGSWELLDIPFAKLAEGGRGSDGSHHWKLLDIPFFTLAEGHAVPPRKGKPATGHMTVADGPLFYVYNQTADDKGRSSVNFLNLPLLGPIFASWSDAEGAHAGLFPRLFSSSYRKN